MGGETVAAVEIKTPQHPGIRVNIIDANTMSSVNSLISISDEKLATLNLPRLRLGLPISISNQHSLSISFEICFSKLRMSELVKRWA
jgi:hypothetical protein